MGPGRFYNMLLSDVAVCTWDEAAIITGGFFVGSNYRGGEAAAGGGPGPGPEPARWYYGPPPRPGGTYLKAPGSGANHLPWPAINLVKLLVTLLVLLLVLKQVILPVELLAF